MKIPNSPAAVSFITYQAILLPLFCKENGKALDPEVSQKTCKAYYFDGFEERPEEKSKASAANPVLIPFPFFIAGHRCCF